MSKNGTKAPTIGNTTSADDVEPVAGQIASPGALQPRTRQEAAKLVTAAFGDLVYMMSRIPAYRNVMLKDLDGLVLPAIRNRQFAILEVPAPGKPSGADAAAAETTRDDELRMPVAFVTWAMVSQAVDQRLTDGVKGPLTLSPPEWRSGEIPWVIVAGGDSRGLKTLIDELHQRKWAGKSVRIRVGEGDQARVELLKPGASSDWTIAGSTGG